MLRTFKRLLSGFIAGAALQPGSGAAVVREEHREQREFGQIETSLSDCAASSWVDSRRYSGPKMLVDESFQWKGKITSRGGTWRNISTDREAAETELNEFIRSRTR